ncbi:MAG: glycoside hydrolase family 75 protein, partial [Nannocystaceae bacterium]
GWLKNSQSGVSAHYVVKEDGGEITQLVYEAKKAWHIAASYKCSLNNNTECGRNGASSNNFTIGIEHAGYANQAAWSSGQINESAKLVCDITKDNGIPRDKYHVVGHGQLQPNNRIDPGPNWPWASYLQKINDYCGNPMPEPEPEPMPEPEPEPLPEPEPEPMPEPEPEPPAGEITVDNDNANNNPAVAKFEASGNWTVAASTPGYHGTNYAYASTQAVSDAAYFSFYLDAPQTRTIDVWYTAGTNRSPTAPIVVFDAQGATLGNVKVDMQKNGSQWVEVGTYNFTAGWNKVALSRWTSTGYVAVADAVRVRGDGMMGQQPDDGEVTVEKLLALTKTCTPVAGTSKFKNDSGGTASVQVCQLNGAVFWTADADIDCDGGKGASCLSDPYYQGETSAKDSMGNFVDASTVPYLVVPLSSNGFNPANHGIKTSWSGYGSAGIAIYNGKMVYAPYADAGPSGVIGELSQAAAAQLGIPTSPISGGVGSGVTYIVFTGNQYVNPIESASQAKSVTESLAKQLIANN